MMQSPARKIVSEILPEGMRVLPTGVRRPRRTLAIFSMESAESVKHFLIIAIEI
jgi:hypothetical protein